MAKNLHAGHRARMRKRFLRCGGGELPDHNLLEMLLFYAIPRRDTNEMAHIILNKAGSLEKLFNMTKEQLVANLGLSAHLAEYISTLGAFCTAPPRAARRRYELDDGKSVVKQIARRYDSVTKAIFVAVLLNNRKGCLTHIELKINRGRVDRESVEELLTVAKRFRVSEAVLLQCLPKRVGNTAEDFSFAEHALYKAGIGVSECFISHGGKLHLVKRQEDRINL